MYISLLLCAYEPINVSTLCTSLCVFVFVFLNFSSSVHTSDDKKHWGRLDIEEKKPAAEPKARREPVKKFDMEHRKSVARTEASQWRIVWCE